MRARAKRAALAQAPLDSREFRRLMDGRLSEAAWQKQVERALDVCGWWWMHVPPNVIVCEFTGRRHYRGIRKGVPDIWAIRPPYMLWLELKTETGPHRPEQDQVMDRIRACDLLAIAARPRDREQVLALLSRPEVFYAALKDEQQRARAPHGQLQVPWDATTGLGAQAQQLAFTSPVGSGGLTNERVQVCRCNRVDD